MRGSVNRRAAGVHPDLSRVYRIEWLQVVGQRVVEAYLDHFRAKCKTVIVSDASASSKRRRRFAREKIRDRRLAKSGPDTPPSPVGLRRAGPLIHFRIECAPIVCFE